MLELREKLITPKQALALKDAGVEMESFHWTKTSREYVEKHGDNLDEFLIRGGRCYGITMSKGDIILPLYDITELMEISGINPSQERGILVNYIITNK